MNDKRDAAHVALRPFEDRLIDRVDDAGAQQLAALFAACHQRGALKKLYERSSSSTKLSTRDLRRDAHYADNLRNEIRAATKNGLAGDLLNRIQALSLEGPTHPKHSQTWRQIIDRWNTAHDHGKWRYLPTLCEICGVTVYGRSVDAHGSPSTVCSDECRELRKGRRQSARRYKKVPKKKRT